MLSLKKYKEIFLPNEVSRFEIVRFGVSAK
jgi:hypothetical protein